MVTAFAAFAKARMQSVPRLVVVLTWALPATMERARGVGVGIALTPPSPFGSNEALVLTNCSVSCVVSTTMQGGDCQMIWRASRLRTPLQLSPSVVTRQVLASGIVKPFKPA